MTEPHRYPPGVTCWIDIERDDPHAAAEFYRALFGWQITSAAPPDAPFTYLIATLDGGDVSGIGSAGAHGGEWKTYVAVEDCDATTARAAAAGATVVGEPVDAGPGGRWSELVDPQGAHVRLWQARNRLGSQVVNQPGAWNFSDLLTSDVAAAKRFYGEVFDWRFAMSGFDAIQVDGYGEHLASTVDPDIHERQANAPEGFADVIGAMIPLDGSDPPHWQVTFAVADRDATAERARTLGAEVVGVDEDEWTRSVRLLDPDGFGFVASQFTPPDTW